MAQYLPALIFIVVGFGLAIALMAICFILAPRRYSAEKNSAFECGFPPFGDARMKFDVRFYLVSILFILFDLEVAFLFPWAVVFREVGLSAVIAMAIFLALLVVGFVFEWKKGALEWE